MILNKAFAKCFVLAAMLGWICRQPLFAANISAAFDSANKLYEQGNYAQAAAAYQKLTRSGPVSAALYFNLGNAFFKSGEIGRAIAAYRQAEQLAPRDPDLRANLRYVRERIDGPTLSPSRWQHWLGRLTLNEWTLLAAAALWLWLLLLALTQLRPDWRRPLRHWLRHWLRLGGVAALALCVLAAAAFRAESADMAVVVARDAAVHNGPLNESKTMFTVHDGAELSVLDRRRNWLKVSAGDSRVGWLKSGEVLLLARPA